MHPIPSPPVALNYIWFYQTNKTSMMWFDVGTIIPSLSSWTTYAKNKNIFKPSKIWKPNWIVWEVMLISHRPKSQWFQRPTLSQNNSKPKTNNSKRKSKSMKTHSLRKEELLKLIPSWRKKIILKSKQKPKKDKKLEKSIDWKMSTISWSANAMKSGMKSKSSPNNFHFWKTMLPTQLNLKVML